MTKKLFRTELKVEQAKPLDDIPSWCLIGSCFAEEMAAKLTDTGFNVVQNPFGVIYNPISIADCVQAIMDKLTYQATDLSRDNDLYFAWTHHGRFKGPDGEGLLQAINHAIAIANHALNDGATIVLTWGTAIVYRMKESGIVVGNCHKFPHNSFDKSVLSPENILDVWIPLLEQLIDAYPKLRIIMTISPVRHFKDGFVQNQLSKSVLFVALHQLLATFPKQLSYFPAYEIIMDDLRDYRFYNQDMIHPGEEALGYIWEKFCETYFSNTTRSMLSEVEKFRAMQRHRPLYPDSAAHNTFQRKLEETKKMLLAKYTGLQLD